MIIGQEKGPTLEKSRHELAANIRAYLTQSALRRLGDQNYGLPAVLKERESNLTLQRPAESPEFTAKISSIIRNALPAGRQDMEEQCREQCKELSRIYWGLGEHMAPFYAAFADWVEAKVSDLGSGVVLVFSGRDSFPFLVTYNNRHKERERAYIPSNRFTLKNHYRRLDLADEQEREQLIREKETIALFYERRGLTGKDIVVIDFGRRGRNERAHQAVLIELGRPRFNIKKVLLAYKYDGPLFDGFLLPKSFDPNKVQEIISADETLRRSIFGFTNEIDNAGSIVQFLYRDGDGMAITRQKNAFAMTLQEIGAGLMSTGGDLYGITRDKAGLAPEYVLVSAQELAARFAFLEAVKRHTKGIPVVSKEEVAERLNYFYHLFKKYQPVYGMMTDGIERVNQDVGLAHMIIDANRVLKQRGEPELSIL